MDWLGMFVEYGLPILSLLAIYAVKKWVVPLLVTAEARRKAQLIANIADDLTDHLLASHGESDIARWLDGAVNELINVCKLEKKGVFMGPEKRVAARHRAKDIAERAMDASLRRKGLKSKPIKPLG